MDNNVDNLKNKINNLRAIKWCVFAFLLLCILMLFIPIMWVFCVCLCLGLVLFIVFLLLSNKINKLNIDLKKLEQKELQLHLSEHERLKLLTEKSKNHTYRLKTKTITNTERYYLNIINKAFGEDYEIRFQVPLSSIIEKEKSFKNEYQSELNRIVDIGIFDKKTTAPLLLIEINDNTHYWKSRQSRDNKVKSICEDAGIDLLTFWTDANNTEERIVNSINKELGR